MSSTTAFWPNTCAAVHPPRARSSRTPAPVRGVRARTPPRAGATTIECSPLRGSAPLRFAPSGPDLRSFRSCGRPAALGEGRARGRSPRHGLSTCRLADSPTWSKSSSRQVDRSPSRHQSGACARPSQSGWFPPRAARCGRVSAFDAWGWFCYLSNPSMRVGPIPDRRDALLRPR